MPIAAVDRARPSLKARDLQRLAGLTYRQLNDWEHRAGVLASERVTEDGWRRFTWDDALALCICSDLRRQFALPLKGLGSLYLWLIGKKSDPVSQALAVRADVELWELEQGGDLATLRELQGDAFAEAMKDVENRRAVQDFIELKLNSLATRPVVLAMQMARLGLPAYLCTTLESSQILQERNLVRWAGTRAVQNPTLVVPLNARIENFRQALHLPPVGLDSVLRSFEDCWAGLMQGEQVSDAERRVLDVLRTQPEQRVTVHVENGNPKQIDVHHDLAPAPSSSTARAIADLIDGRRHQTLEVIVRDGKVVAIRRKTVEKLSSARGTHRKR